MQGAVACREILLLSPGRGRWGRGTGPRCEATESKTHTATGLESVPPRNHKTETSPGLAPTTSRWISFLLPISGGLGFTPRCWSHFL